MWCVADACVSVDGMGISERETLSKITSHVSRAASPQLLTYSNRMGATIGIRIGRLDRTVVDDGVPWVPLP